MRPDCVTGQLLAVKTAVVIKILIITSYKKRQSEGLRVNLNNNNNSNSKNRLMNNGHHYHEIYLRVTDIKILVFFRGDEHIYIVGG